MPYWAGTGKMHEGEDGLGTLYGLSGNRLLGQSETWCFCLIKLQCCQNRSTVAVHKNTLKIPRGSKSYWGEHKETELMLPRVLVVTEAPEVSCYLPTSHHPQRMYLRGAGSFVSI